MAGTGFRPHHRRSGRFCPPGRGRLDAAAGQARLATGGQIAITYGYQKYDDQIVWLCVALTIIIVQILQEFGMYIARRTDRRSRT